MFSLNNSFYFSFQGPHSTGAQVAKADASQVRQQGPDPGEEQGRVCHCPPRMAGHRGDGLPSTGKALPAKRPRWKGCVSWPQGIFDPCFVW